MGSLSSLSEVQPVSPDLSDSQGAKGHMLFKFARMLSRTVHSLPTARTMLKSAAFGGLALVLLWQGWSVLMTVLITLLAYLATGGWAFAKIVVRTLPRDLR